MVVVPGANSTRLLKIGRPAFMPVVVVTICGLSASGLPSEQNTRVLADADGLAPSIAIKAAAIAAAGTMFIHCCSVSLRDVRPSRRVACATLLIRNDRHIE